MYLQSNRGSSQGGEGVSPTPAMQLNDWLAINVMKWKESERIYWNPSQDFNQTILAANKFCNDNDLYWELHGSGDNIDLKDVPQAEIYSWGTRTNHVGVIQSHKEPAMALGLAIKKASKKVQG